MKRASTKRREERVQTALKVDLDNAVGLTRNFSASGIFFQTNPDGTLPSLGSEINFSIDLDSPAGKLTLRCTGEIVRVEQKDDLVDVAAKIISSKLELAH
jgi:hypothetical protein